MASNHSANFAGHNLTNRDELVVYANRKMHWSGSRMEVLSSLEKRRANTPMSEEN